MHYSPFYSNYSAFVKAGDKVMVKDILTSEIANAVVERKEDIIDALNRSGLYVDSSVSTKQLSAVASDNLSNPKFVRRLSSIIGSKHPADFEHFSNASGTFVKDDKGKSHFRKRPVTEIDYFNDVFIAVSGNVEKGDAKVMEKVSKISTDDTEEKGSNKKANLTLLGIIAVCGVAVWAIGIKKIV